MLAFVISPLTTHSFRGGAPFLVLKSQQRHLRHFQGVQAPQAGVPNVSPGERSGPSTTFPSQPKDDFLDKRSAFNLPFFGRNGSNYFVSEAIRAARRNIANKVCLAFSGFSQDKTRQHLSPTRWEMKIQKYKKNRKRVHAKKKNRNTKSKKKTKNRKTKTTESQKRQEFTKMQHSKGKKKK